MEEKRIEDMTREEMENELERYADQEMANQPDEPSGSGKGIAILVAGVAATAMAAVLLVKKLKKAKKTDQESQETAEESKTEPVQDANFKEVPAEDSKK